MKQVELEQELTRLLAQEKAPESLVSTLRDQMPDANELGSLASRLALQGVPIAPSPPAAGSAAWKPWGALGGGALAALGLWLALGGGASPIPAAAGGRPVPSPGQLAPRAPASASAPESALVRDTPRAPRPTPVEESPAEPAPATSIPPAALAPAEPPAAAVATMDAPHPDAIAPAPTRPLRANASPGSAPVSDAARQELSSRSETPSEIELLREARLSLRSSPARALELSEQHARSYPGGKLAQERELLAITALVSLGRRTAALARAARFEQSFPASPYRRQLGELLQ